MIVTSKEKAGVHTQTAQIPCIYSSNSMKVLHTDVYDRGYRSLKFAFEILDSANAYWHGYVFELGGYDKSGNILAFFGSQKESGRTDFLGKPLLVDAAEAGDANYPTYDSILRSTKQPLEIMRDAADALKQDFLRRRNQDALYNITTIRDLLKQGGPASRSDTIKIQDFIRHRDQVSLSVIKAMKFLSGVPLIAQKAMEETGAQQDSGAPLRK